MQRYILSRILQGLVVLVVSSLLIFITVRLTGSPVSLLLPADATQADVDRLTRELGLDRPIHEQYLAFASNTLRGDFGNSIMTKRPVMELVMDRLPNSMRLGGLSLTLALALGLPLGVVAAVRRGSFLDILARTLAVLGQSVPSFWLAIVLIAIFAGWLKILPAARLEGPGSYVLPVLTLTLSGFLFSGTVRFVRSGMLDVLNTEYVKLARAKGLSESKVVWKHALRNAAIPLVTFLGFYFALLIGGASLVIETVFAWPGVGTLLNQAAFSRDFPVVQALVVIFVVAFVIINLLVDILYAFLDPRIRFQ